MSNYTEYLAANVLNEERTITYRILSRALKVHINLAKQMLYEFHQKQNKKKPGTVHATYLISGRQRDPDAEDSSQHNATQSQDSRGDIPMSSPFPSSAPHPDNEETQPRFMQVIVVAKEEDLEEAKSAMDEIDCVHIYSLEPGSVKDIQVLTDCHRRLEAEFREDPLVVNKQYGIIQNAEVRRRTNKRPAPAAAPVPAAKPPVKAAPAAKKEEPKVEEKEMKQTDTVTAAHDASDVDSDASSKKAKSSKPPALKRDSSSIFKSFAKSKPKAAKKEAHPQSQTSTEASPAISDDEADEDTIMADEDSVDKPTGKSKKDREDELKKMMEAEDEPMDDASAAEADEEPESEPKSEPVIEAPKEEPKDEIEVSNGRRRGRRRVMKKVTTKDAEGYLVTKEEPTWEEFSEDEPEPPAKKAKPVPPPAAAKGAPKKGGKGQGSIMSFFAKK